MEGFLKNESVLPSKETNEEKLEIFEEFQQREKEVINSTSNVIENLPEDKLRTKAARLLSAVTILISASSAFADDGGKDVEKIFDSQTQTGPAAKTNKNEVAPFGWQKIAATLEVSVGDSKRKENLTYNPEVVKSPYYHDVSSSNFYKEVSLRGLWDVMDLEYFSVKNSLNVEQFLTSLQKGSVHFDDHEKILVLQELGAELLKTYNVDMFNSNSHVSISEAEMFNVLKDYRNGKWSESGTCGNIHTFLAKVGEHMGLETWTQSGSMGASGDQQIGHIWTGAVIKDKNGKGQIVDINYGTVVPTGTLNFKDSLGVMEKYMKGVSIFGSYVGNAKGEVLFPVKSLAGEVASEAVGLQNTSNRLEQNVSTGEVSPETKGLTISISPEKIAMKITGNTLGLVYTNFKNKRDNPYQSLDDLEAFQGNINLKNENFGLKANATVLHMNVKDLEGGTFAQNEVALGLIADYVDKHAFTKKEYGQFALNWGATIQGALATTAHSKKDFSQGSDGMFEGGEAVRVLYINPSETGKFYLDASGLSRGITDNYEDQRLVFKKVSETFAVGGSIAVHEAQILNLEVAKSNFDWGQKITFEGGVKGETWSGRATYEKSASDYERFVPSSEKISAELSRKVNFGETKGEIVVLGSTSTEHYKGADTSGNYGAEIKMRIFLH